MVLELTDGDYVALVESTDKALFIDFYSPMCGPCQEVQALLPHLDNYFKDKEMYKPAAMLISMNWLPGEKTIFTKQADWVLNGYTQRAPNLWRLSNNVENKSKCLANYKANKGTFSSHGCFRSFFIMVWMVWI